MELFWKGAAGILIGAVLCLTLGKREGDLALLLTMAVCCMVSVGTLRCLQPVISFLFRLEALAGISSGVLKILLKITGVGLVTELAAMICREAGNISLAGSMQFLGSVVMVQLSIPIWESLLELMENILGVL